VANLVHWIDNLAGSSIGKTVRTYRIYWAGRFGSPTEQEKALLATWSEIRAKPVLRPGAKILNEQGCLPQSEHVPTWRNLFRVRSYEAESVDAFVESMAGDLTPREKQSLREVIETFRPRFDEAWEEMTFLRSFEIRLRRFLAESELRPYLGGVAGFFGVNPDPFPPGRIHLMALPGESGTHAQANGRHLLIEIRPNDTPREQVQVIAHETSHYLWQLLAPERNDAMALQVHETSAAGPVFWRLLREGLPTALGQGLALAEVAPMRFGFQYRWYHTDAHDSFAKAIYPMVASAFRAGEGVEDGVLEEIARRVEGLHAIREAVPVDYLMNVAFISGEGMFPAFREIRSRTFILNNWNYSAYSPEGEAFLERYGCLNGVVMLGPKEIGDPGALPELFRPPEIAANGSARSSIRMVRRPGGGVLFYLTAAREEEIPRVAEAFLNLRRLPEEPVYLD
jgi:hypothetical protein